MVLSFNQKFQLFGRNGDAGFDLYRTDFQNQAVVDVMQSPQQVLFYNLKGNLMRRVCKSIQL